MGFIRWEAAYNTGIKEIDEQHRQLMQFINELYENYQAGHERQIIETTLKRLVSYAVMHFSREEEMFERFEYPDAEAHKQEHLDFEEKITAFEKNLKDGSSTLELDMLKFLSGWLIGHIQGSDQLYVPYLKLGLI